MALGGRCRRATGESRVVMPHLGAGARWQEQVVALVAVRLPHLRLIQQLADLRHTTEPRLRKADYCFKIALISMHRHPRGTAKTGHPCEDQLIAARATTQRQAG